MRWKEGGREGTREGGREAGGGAGRRCVSEGGSGWRARRQLPFRKILRPYSLIPHPYPNLNPLLNHPPIAMCLTRSLAPQPQHLPPTLQPLTLTLAPIRQPPQLLSNPTPMAIYHMRRVRQSPHPYPDPSLPTLTPHRKAAHEERAAVKAEPYFLIPCHYSHP